MSLNMEQRYSVRVRNYAKDIVDYQKQNPEVVVTPSANYLLDDISSRYEKTCINRLKRTVAREIKNLKRYGIGKCIEELEMTIKILNKRLEVLEK